MDNVLNFFIFNTTFPFLTWYSPQSQVRIFLLALQEKSFQLFKPDRMTVVRLKKLFRNALHRVYYIITCQPCLVQKIWLFLSFLLWPILTLHLPRQLGYPSS